MTEPWRPRERIFSPGSPGLDPRLFNGDELKPAFRKRVLDDIRRFWGPRYPSWESWSKVYLAGGAASHWISDHNDLDILIGVDWPKLYNSLPALRGLSRSVICQRFNGELYHGLNSDHFKFAGDNWERTFFVNSDSYDIRQIKPYAAYNLTDDAWAVRPIEAGPTWGPNSFNPATWSWVEHSIAHVRHILNDLHGWARQKQAEEYYTYLHNDRTRAFGPFGDGLVDRGNVILKALDQHPDHLLERLIEASRGEDRMSKASSTEFLPNPNGGHDWHHGSPKKFEHFDEDHEPDDYDDESERETHWNSHMGQHWTSLPHVAERFARGGFHHQYEHDNSHGQIFTANLGIKNAKHYPLESQMDTEAVKHNWNYAESHDPMEAHNDHCRKGDCYGLHEHEPGDEVDHKVRRFYSDPHHAAHWMTSHPDSANLADRFRSHLQERGHDGVTYGNEVEQPHGHHCAITFNTDQIHNLRRQELAPVSHLERMNLTRNVPPFERRANNPISFHHVDFKGNPVDPASLSQEEIHNRHAGRGSEWGQYEHQVRHNGNVVGRLQYTVDGHEPSYISIDGMATHPKYRGAGHATAMQLRLQEQAKRHGQTIYHGDRSTNGHAWWQSFKQHPQFDPKVHDMEEFEPVYDPKEVYDQVMGHQSTLATPSTEEWDHYYDTPGWRRDLPAR